MDIAFVVMQINNPELDKVCQEAIVPALKANGLDPKRVDKHNEGGLLKNEIIKYIQEAQIIVADLTNERPNVYLEVGYTMGAGKNRNLILTVREDHNVESPTHKTGGAKVHFDLSGYDLLFWEPNKIDEFRIELEKRIKRRLSVIRESTKGELIIEDEWFSENETRARKGLGEIGYDGYMEVRFVPDDFTLNANYRELVDAVKGAVINTFGWPIGVIFDGHPREQYRPHPTPNGIVSELKFADTETGLGTRKSYDYWALRTSGEYFLLRNLFEQQRRPEKRVIFFNTRIVRVAETFLFCARLYDRLGVDREKHVKIRIKHGGLAGRAIDTSNLSRSLAYHPVSYTDEMEQDTVVKIADIELNLVKYTKTVCEPLFAQFEMYEFADIVYEQIVNDFINGKVT